ncbi:VanZ family protein [Tunicatimonas pelagia]|uniref:VanZ family protein n=1 Tax=Tunicatimonas pelagia TaxID=931531 RepID=UPI0026668258|nr:VanZ family protein [Tunicatimonas pelagia]WKN40853.1 VanZ family protein [Tunicatimonas pelagia]
MFWRFNLYTLLWMILILVLIILPGQHLPQTGTSLFSIDKIVHTGIFAGLALLMAIGFAKQRTYYGLRNKAATYALIVSVGYASILESTQIFSEGRTIDMYDAIANTVGCVAGYGMFFVIYRR